MSLVTPDVVTDENTSVATDVGVEVKVEDTAVASADETIEEQVVEQETTEVAVATEAKAPVATSTSGGSMQAFYEEQAEAGLEGLEIDAFSFDRIKLQDGEFIMGENTELGKAIQFRVMTTRPLYIVRQSDDQDAEMFYSYAADGSTLMDGTSSEAKLNEWKEDGYGVDSPFDIKRYMEVMAELVSGGEHAGSIVSLSIPPASYKKFSGQAAIANLRYKRKLNEGVVVEASVGASVSGAGGKNFRPWQFRIASID